MPELFQSFATIIKTLMNNPWGIIVLLLGLWLIIKLWSFSIKLMALGVKGLIIIPVAVILTIILVWFFGWMMPNIAGFVGQKTATNWVAAAEKYNVPVGNELPAGANPFAEMFDSESTNPTQPTQASTIKGAWYIVKVGATFREGPNGTSRDLLGGNNIPVGTRLQILDVSPGDGYCENGECRRVKVSFQGMEGWVHLVTLSKE